jgi:hypothetical protein
MLGAARGRSDGDGRCMHARMCAAVALVSARSARELDLARRTHGRFCDLLLGMCCSAPSPGCCPLLLRSRRALASCYYRPRSAGAFFSLPCLVQLDPIGLGSTGCKLPPDRQVVRHRLPVRTPTVEEHAADDPGANCNHPSAPAGGARHHYANMRPLATDRQAERSRYTDISVSYQFETNVRRTRHYITDMPSEAALEIAFERLKNASKDF